MQWQKGSLKLLAFILFDVLFSIDILLILFAEIKNGSIASDSLRQRVPVDDYPVYNAGDRLHVLGVRL